MPWALMSGRLRRRSRIFPFWESLNFCEDMAAVRLGRAMLRNSKTFGSFERWPAFSLSAGSSAARTLVTSIHSLAPLFHVLSGRISWRRKSKGPVELFQLLSLSFSTQHHPTYHHSPYMPRLPLPSPSSSPLLTFTSKAFVTFTCRLPYHLHFTSLHHTALPLPSRHLHA